MIYKPGDLVLIPFPFSDLTALKKRPVLIFSIPDHAGDFLAVPITTQSHHNQSLELKSKHLFEGTLPKTSWLRADKIYTLNERLIVKKFGNVHSEFFTSAKEKICKYIGCCTDKQNS